MAGRPVFSLAWANIFHRKRAAGPVSPPVPEPGVAPDSLSVPRGIAFGLLLSAVVWGLLATLLL
jgi:hypothetical protein